MISRDTRVAWAGGFLEGEGCFALEKASPRSPYTRNLRISVCQRKREPLERLVVLFGGEITARPHGGKQMYWWRISGAARVVPILEDVIPWLCAKRRDAEVLLRFAQEVLAAPPRLTDDQKARRLSLIDEMKGIRAACLF